MKAIEFDEKFDNGEDVSEFLDFEKSNRIKHNPKRINVDMPLWMIQKIDLEASRLGVTRQSIIKFWVAERLQAKQHS